VRELRRTTHQTIAKVTRDLEDSFHFNTALAALMELQTTLSRFQELLPSAPQGDGRNRALAFVEGLTALVVLLAPFAPHLAEELWEVLGHGESVFRRPWPTPDSTLAQEDVVEVVVQVNGKVRARLQVPKGTPEEDLRRQALGEPRVQPWVAGKPLKKAVVIPDKLVNIVVAG
jgi:leucyl-tRNA synthetase